MDDSARPDEVAALRRTIRRCTAVLVVAVGVHLTVVAPDTSDWGLLLATVAGFYLFASVTDLEGGGAETEGDGTAGDDADDTDDAGDGGGSAGRSDADG